MLITKPTRSNRKGARSNGKGDSHEQGSAMILIPALAIIVVLAAGLVLDSAIGFTAKRDLVEAAAAAANDAANAVADEDLYNSGQTLLRPELVEDLAAASLRARTSELGPVQLRSARLIPGSNPPQVEIVAAGQADRLFSRITKSTPTWNFTTTVRGTAREN
jgi:hypothetical protein